MNKNKILIGTVVIVLALGGWYYFSSVKAPEPEQTEKTQPTTEAQNTANNPVTGSMETGELPPGTDVGASAGASAGATVSTGVVKSFTVTGSNFAFAPNSLSVKKGDTVKITFKNSNGSHNLVIDEFNATTPIIGSGQSAVLEFTASKTGSFEYYCSVGNHRAMGMKGTLVVTE